MPDTPIRLSPIHHLLETHHADAAAEPAAIQSLGLCDLSFLTKLGLKGPGSEDWLAAQEVDVPSELYESRRLDDGGFVVRLGLDEFLLESGVANVSVPALAAALDSNHANVFCVERQDATFWLVGPKALEVLSQTCGVDFCEAVPHRLVLTRVAGVSCGVFPDSLGYAETFRFWVDPSYAVYLWETLAEICEDLGGRVIDAGCLFPELG